MDRIQLTLCLYNYLQGILLYFSRTVYETIIDKTDLKQNGEKVTEEIIQEAVYGQVRLIFDFCKIKVKGVILGMKWQSKGIKILKFLSNYAKIELVKKLLRLSLLLS